MMMKLPLFVLFLMIHAAAAQQTGKPESPRRLAPRPIPGMTAPAKPAEPSSLPGAKAISRPAAITAPETSGPARILFIHRRGSFRLPEGAMEIKAPEVEGTLAGRPAPGPVPLAEGKVRIIPGLREAARAVPLVSPPPPARPEVKTKPAKENQTP